MKDNRINVNDGNMEVMVNTLLSRIKMLEGEVRELQSVSIDNKYREFRRPQEDSMTEALKEKGIEWHFEKGGIAFCDGGLYLMCSEKANGEVVCSAWLYDFSCDCVHEYGMELGNGIVFEKCCNPRPASEFEVILFDHELAKKGYKRGLNGNLVKI